MNIRVEFYGQVVATFCGFLLECNLTVIKLLSDFFSFIFCKKKKFGSDVYAFAICTTSKGDLEKSRGTSRAQRIQRAERVGKDIGSKGISGTHGDRALWGETLKLGEWLQHIPGTSSKISVKNS